MLLVSVTEVFFVSHNFDNVNSGMLGVLPKSSSTLLPIHLQPSHPYTPPKNCEQ
uniref:Uncharacterized protein n=1 Tax=Arion vulgaris TaxID=1028688 RepID=A0A0B6Z6E9_9EUPU